MVLSSIRSAALVCCLLLGAAQAQEAAPAPKEIQWVNSYTEAIEAAGKQQKPVLIDFYADWCGPCKMMEAQTYSDPRVIQALGDFVSIKVDIDQDSKTAFAYQIRSIPRTIILNVHQEVIGDQIGFLGGDEFLKLLKDAGEYAFKRTGGLRMSMPAGEPVLDAGGMALAELIELLAAKEPARRKKAMEELARQDSEETRAALAKCLASDYLGTRIAAWAVLSGLAKDIEAVFDPWAPKQERQEALGTVWWYVKGDMSDGF